MGDIALLVPSRGRVGQAMAMWSSAKATAAWPNRVQLFLGIDNDDPAWRGYMNEFGDAEIMNGPRQVLSVYWNNLADLALLYGCDILWHGNDDVIFHPPADGEPPWDVQVRQAFEQWPDRIGCVHGRDGIHDGGMATLGFYSDTWVRALGYFCPPIFASDYNDAWLSGCADRVGRRAFRSGVFTEHMHYVVGKAVQDQTHLDRLAHQAEADQRWRDTSAEREADVAKLQNAILAARA